MEKIMLKTLHQIELEIEGEFHKYAFPISSDFVKIEKALMGFMQFIGQIKAQQLAAQQAAQAPAQTPNPDVASAPVQEPPQVVS
jgi:hypothetical protein